MEMKGIERAEYAKAKKMAEATGRPMLLWTLPAAAFYTEMTDSFPAFMTGAKLKAMAMPAAMLAEMNDPNKTLN